MKKVSALIALIVFALGLTVCGGSTTPVEPGPVPTPTATVVPSITPTPMPVPSNTPTPIPTPTLTPTPAGRNSMSYVSSDPLPGSILPLEAEVSVTVDYHALQDGMLFVLPAGGSVFTSGGNGSKVTAGTGRITAKFTAGGSGTSTGIFMSLHDTRNMEVLAVTVPNITYTWTGTYIYKLTFVSATPPSGSTIRVGDPVTFRVEYASYQAVKFQASFNPLGISCLKSEAWTAAIGESIATFKCTSPQAGESTSVTFKMTTADGISVLSSVEDPTLAFTWH